MPWIWRQAGTTSGSVVVVRPRAQSEFSATGLPRHAPSPATRIRSHGQRMLSIPREVQGIGGPIRFIEDARPPRPVRQVPLDGLGQATVQVVTGRPSETGAQLRSIHGVAAIVAGAVGDELDQRFRLAEQSQQASYELEVRELASPADIVYLAEDPAGEHGPQGLGVIFDEQPIAVV